EPLVDAVELIPSGKNLLEPLPLNDCGFVERGRRIRVVLEQLRRRLSVVDEIEPAVDRGRLLVPGPLDERAGVLGSLELVETAALDDLAGRGDAHLVELIGRALELVDLGGREDVVRRLVPVRLRRRVENEAELYDLRLPGDPRIDRDPAH